MFKFFLYTNRSVAGVNGPVCVYIYKYIQNPTVSITILAGEW
jgi:hypothetical protein